jgi:hypothetical protein
MTALNLDPKTRTVNVGTLKVGHIVVESHAHPAIVVMDCTPGPLSALRKRVLPLCLAGVWRTTLVAR